MVLSGAAGRAADGAPRLVVADDGVRAGMVLAAREMASGTHAAEWSFAPEALGRVLGIASDLPATDAGVKDGDGVPSGVPVSKAPRPAMAAKATPSGSNNAAVAAAVEAARAASVAAAAAAKAAAAAAALVSSAPGGGGGGQQTSASVSVVEAAARLATVSLAPGPSATPAAADVALEPRTDGPSCSPSCSHDHVHSHSHSHAHSHSSDASAPVVPLAAAPVEALHDGVASLKALIKAAHDEGRRGVLVYWAADWSAASVAGTTLLEPLASSAAAMRCARVDVSGSDAGMALAMAHVLRPSVSNSRRLVLRAGLSFPVVTLFPALPDATEALAKGRSVSKADEATVAAAIAELAGLPDDTAEEAEDMRLEGVIYITDGAPSLKAVLKDTTTADARVILLWVQETEGDEGDDDAEALEALQAAAESAEEAYYLAVAAVPAVEAAADIAETEANARLAAALGVKRFPQCHVYRGMKLESRHTGLEAIEAFCAGIVGPSAGGERLGKEAVDGGAGGARGGGGEGDFTPPPRDLWKTETRRFKAGKGAFYAKYPCLKCGSAWWVGTDWGARCARCGAKDTSSYDANEMPLQSRAAVYQTYINAVHAGEVPAYDGYCWVPPSR